MTLQPRQHLKEEMPRVLLKREKLCLVVDQSQIKINQLIREQIELKLLLQLERFKMFKM
tara:strand:+ start:593 stop:769 length:177 start_codon:yes stop_codon:yes gene_type:complete